MSSICSGRTSGTKAESSSSGGIAKWRWWSGRRVPWMRRVAGDAGEVEFIDQAVLEGAEGALRATPRLGSVEVVTAAVGVELPGQTLGREHLLECSEGGRGAPSFSTRKAE